MSNTAAGRQRAAANTHTPDLPPELAAVALVDARTAASTGGMSTSWWTDQVRRGNAPAPVVRGRRCTRWRASDVAMFWRNFGCESREADRQER